MRVVFFVVGTHGDALPVAALGRGLRELGHVVTVATSHDHRGLIEAQGLAWSALSPSYADAIADAEGEPGIGTLRAHMAEASGQWADQARDASTGAELVIGSGLAMGALGNAVGEWLGIPSVGIGVMPLTPTRAFPPPVPRPPKRAMPSAYNYGLAWTVRRAVWQICFARPVARLRRDLGLSPRARHAWTGRMLYNFSPHLLPQPADWPQSQIRVTGSWTIPNRAGEPETALRDFVSAGDKPVAIGFGSMRLAAEGRVRLSAAVLDAIRRSGRRAVVIRGWGALDLASDQDVIVVDVAPYEWLLSRVSMIVHHGGAGTVAAAARAGIPQVVVPFVADQFFWGWQLCRLGVSPAALSRERLDGLSMAAAIEAAAGMHAQAERLGARMRDEDGVGTAIAALESWGVLRPV